MIKNFGALSYAVVLGLLAGCGDDDDSNNATSIPVTIGEPTQKVLAVSENGHDRLFGVAFDKDGNYYATGSVADGTDATADSKMLVAKFKADGELDTSFGTNGYAIHNITVGATAEVARSILIQSSGKIIMAGPLEYIPAEGDSDADKASDRDIAVVRLNADGSLDSTFGTNGVLRLDLSKGEQSGTGYLADNFGGMTADDNGRLLIHGSKKREGGTDTDFVLVRLSADGVLDNTFGTNGQTSLDIRNLSATPKVPIVLSNGNILATGYMRDDTVTPAVVTPVVYRTDADGKLDTTYGTNGFYNEAVLTTTTEVYAAVPQGDSIVTVGYGRNNTQENVDFLSLRINADGTRDTSYGANSGYTRIDAQGFGDNGRFMTMLPDGRLLLVGGGRTDASTSDGMIVVLNADGQPDTSFTDSGVKLLDFGGPADFIWGAAVAPDRSKAVVVGLKGASSTAADGEKDDDIAIVTIPLQ